MPKILRGTGDAQGNVVLRGNAAGVNKLKCPKCGGSATEVKRPDGKIVSRCSSCSIEFQSVRL